MHRRLLPLFLLLTTALAAPAVGRASCGAGYTYAGVASREHVFGVAARLTALAAADVKNGHVAGWVGVGGPGQGPDGASEWIQVGFSGFPGLAQGSLYYEVAQPGHAPIYREVATNIERGSRHMVAVLEMTRRHGWWRVWVDGRPVSRPYYLPGSHGAWPGVATAENWGGGSTACNLYAYRFQRVSLASAPGGGWQRARTVYPIHRGSENRLLLSSPSTFVARTAALPVTPRPRPTRPPATTGTASVQTATAAQPQPSDSTAAANAATAQPSSPDPPAAATPTPVDASQPEGATPSSPGLTNA